MSKVDTWFGYWDIRIRDPREFTTIRTPNWASHAATEMTKEWIISAANDFSIAPHLIPDQQLEGITLVRAESSRGQDDEGEAHARQGKLPNGQWVTQSILIPKLVNINGTVMDIPDVIASQIACYIAGRLDKSDDLSSSPPSLCPS